MSKSPQMVSIDQTWQPRPTLNNIPSEILNIIIYFTDRSSLVRLKRVCRALSAVDDRSLWEHLHLALPEWYGMWPQIFPRVPEIVDYLDISEVIHLNRRHRVGTREKVKAVIRAAGTAKWGFVKILSLTPRLGAVGPMLLVLDYVSPQLERLNIDVTPYPSFYPDLARFELLHLNPDLIDFPLNLPHLSHLELTSLSISHIDFLVKVLHFAPNLRTLDIGFNIDPYNNASDDSDYEGTYDSPEKVTALRYLRCSFIGKVEHRAAELFLEILEKSPKVQQIILSFDSDWMYLDTWEALQHGIGKHEKVEEVRLPVERIQLMQAPKSLSSLVILTARWELTLDLPPFPNLTTLYLQQSPHSSDPRLPAARGGMAEFLHSTFTSAVLSSLAASLRRYPVLSLIHMLPDAVDISALDLLTRSEAPLGGLKGYIHSIRCGDDELIRLSFAAPPGGGETAGGESGLRPTSVARELSYSDYRGKSVPPGVIRALQEEDGREHGIWGQRGLELGPKAWSILEEWYQGSVE